MADAKNAGDVPPSMKVRQGSSGEVMVWGLDAYSRHSSAHCWSPPDAGVHTFLSNH